MADNQSLILTLIDQHQSALLDDWLDCMARVMPSGGVLRRDGNVAQQARRFLEQLRRSGQNRQFEDISAADWAPMREILEEVSRDRVTQGFSPSETATFIFSLKEPLFQLLRQEIRDADRFADEIWTVTRLLDALGLYTVECFSRNREKLISRQQQELLELSTHTTSTTCSR